MKTSLAHLPIEKKKELKAIKRIILEIVPQVEMIILFGSHARGDWVEDAYVEDGRTYTYHSDFDLLLVFEAHADAENIGLENKLRQAIEKSYEVYTHPSLIMHTIKFVNKSIDKASYFFTDIKKEGVMLYTSKRHTLSRIRKLKGEERRENAQDDFDHWIEKADGFLDLYEYALSKGRLKLAAFQMHQAVEGYYTAILLVFTGYKPKSHDLEVLNDKICNLDPDFAKAFPRQTEEEKHHFDLLKKAYIDARYKKSYAISLEELKYIEEKVKVLVQHIHRICQAKIESFSK